MLAGVAVGNGGSRRWWLHRPRGRAPGARPPLLVLLHGCDQDAAGFAALTRMNRLADQQGFMVLHLEQDRLANGQRCWNWFDTRRGRAQAEAALVLQAVDQVVQRHRADAGRVALVGLSAGASLAALLALRHPDRFAAVVMHSGVPPGQAHSTLSALAAMRGRALREAAERVAGAPALPALLVIHGDADTVVSPRNAQQAVLDWAAAAGARASPPRTVQRGQRHALTLTDHRVGRRLVAQLALVSGLGHAWSGGAPGLRYSDPRGPDASRLAWAFIHRQFSARTRAAAPA